jgi:hypothetical protein
MNPLTPILAIVGLLVAAASGGPTNPAGWDPTWSLPLGAAIALAGVISLIRDWRRLSWQHSYRKEKPPYDRQ